MTTSGPPFRARPFLKWAGGKTQLLQHLIDRCPDQFGTYFEPFLGGGALFFALRGLGKIRRATLSDLNPNLIDAYLGVRDYSREVIELVKSYPHNEHFYYHIRATDTRNSSLVEKAARIIYLNKTCYNGLYRENRRGQFNVPFGKYKNPTICDEANLLAVAEVLRGVDIFPRPFDEVLELAVPGDLVYFDPPYDPVSTTASFTSYEKNGFTTSHHEKLADVFAELSARGVFVLLSNSDTPLTRKLYGRYNPDRVLASRAVNCDPSARGKVVEIIVRGYDRDRMRQRALLDRRAVGAKRKPSSPSPASTRYPRKRPNGRVTKPRARPA